MLTVGICLFDEVEVLDFAGPFEVFSLAENAKGEKLFNVITISEQSRIIKARNGLSIMPDYTYQNHPKLDVLVIPGGYGAEQIQIHNRVILDWIKSEYEKIELLLSVCTGSFLLAEAGLLNHKKATTHWMDLERFKSDYPTIDVLTQQRYVDNGDIITSGGISSGIQASLYTVAKLFDTKTANETARRMEFDFQLSD